VPILHAIVLGIVQGLTEFLPISSSGHLLLVPWLFDWHDFDDSSIEKAFDVALHLGTLIAVVAYFRHELVVYIREGWKALFHRRDGVSTEGRVAWLLLLATIPAALVGAVLQDQIDEHLGKPGIIAVSMIVFGLLLGWADRTTGRRTIDAMGTNDAVVIGAAQVLSLNPGTSRSGITITAGRFRRFERDAAARISFLMAIPVTAGAVVVKMAGLAKDGIPAGLKVPMLVGIVVSGLVGWLAVWGTLRYVRHHSFLPFVIYRVALGITVLVIIATGWR
jgi:undecaprenyl-diphosphatase